MHPKTSQCADCGAPILPASKRCRPCNARIASRASPANKPVGDRPLTATERAKRWRDRHRERLAPEWKARRRAVTLSIYGLTPEDYDHILATQGNACAICHSPDPQHWSGRFQIDHDHETLRVRGLLCAKCNGGLGLFDDDPEKLRAAVRYLATVRIVIPDDRAS